MNRKGIILAGGSGSRLWPITMGISKQLLPVYDKPMIYYPLSLLMLSGIREIAVITTPHDQDQFMQLLGDGEQWGLAIHYIVQPAPEGLAQAYILAESFLDGAPSAMVLGDNLFFGHGLPELLANARHNDKAATVFACRVADPERYGVLEFNAANEPIAMVEKPTVPPSPYAVTGLYFLDGQAPTLAASIKPSKRGELEIADLLGLYLEQGQLAVETFGRGYAWLDTGTYDSLLDASNFVRTLTVRQGLQIGCLEEIAFHAGWIDNAQLNEHARRFAKSSYGKYLASILA